MTSYISSKFIFKQIPYGQITRVCFTRSGPVSPRTLVCLPPQVYVQGSLSERVKGQKYQPQLAYYDRHIRVMGLGRGLSKDLVLSL